MELDFRKPFQQFGRCSLNGGSCIPVDTACRCRPKTKTPAAKRAFLSVETGLLLGGSGICLLFGLRAGGGGRLCIGLGGGRGGLGAGSGGSGGGGLGEHGAGEQRGNQGS